MQSTFAPPGTKASGLVTCQVSAQSGGWRVTDYQWLTPATETSPGYQGAQGSQPPAGSASLSVTVTLTQAS